MSSRNLDGASAGISSVEIQISPREYDVRSDKTQLFATGHLEDPDITSKNAVVLSTPRRVKDFDLFGADCVTPSWAAMTSFELIDNKASS